MLAVIIPTVWLAVALFFVGLCRMAARGDTSAASTGPARLEDLTASRALTPQPAPSRLRRPASVSPCRTASPARAHAFLRSPHGGRQHP
jgi:hypothetical protein